MLDGWMRRVFDPAGGRIARPLVRAGVKADHLTGLGLALGLVAAGCIAHGWTGPALAPLLASRLCDGLDGAVARLTQGSDRGGFNDIVFDFVFYGAIPLAFAVLNPAANAVAAATLLFAFYVNGASFLAFAALAHKRGMATTARGPKSLYFTVGIAEATETIVVFLAMCLLPGLFAVLADVFAVVCLITAMARIALAWKTFA
jgi:phosphatidylglycerophosphate synthase